MNPDCRKHRHIRVRIDAKAGNEDQIRSLKIGSSYCNRNVKKAPVSVLKTAIDTRMSFDPNQKSRSELDIGSDYSIQRLNCVRYRCYRTGSIERVALPLDAQTWYKIVPDLIGYDNARGTVDFRKVSIVSGAVSGRAIAAIG